MADALPPPGTPLCAEEIAVLVGGKLEGQAVGTFHRVQDLAHAGEQDVVFFRSAADETGRLPGQAELQALRQCKAGLMLVDADTEVASRPCIRVANPALAAAFLAQHFTGQQEASPIGVHPTAVVEEGAEVHPSASIGPHCVLRSGAKIADHARLLAQVYVGEDCVVGEASVLHPGVYLGPRVHLGAGCVIQANASLGAEGFGFVWSGEEHVPMPQVGGVRLGNRVHVGANSCVDAGTFQPTLIGDNCLLDNHVQVGHNCKLGRFVILCGKVGISGSVEIGDGAIFAGSAGAAGHIQVGAGARVGAKAAVTSNVDAGATVAGNPAVDYRLHQRMQVMLRRMARGKAN